MSETIRLFIGSAPEHRVAELALIESVREHTRRGVLIEVMRAGSNRWAGWQGRTPTGFTMFRFAIPEVCGFDGFAIYLDSDMIVLEDIAELWDMRQPGHWVQHADRQGDCVSVMDCAAVGRISGWPSLEQLKAGEFDKGRARALLEPIVERSIPDRWNRMDHFVDGDTALLHFTGIRTQPWGASPQSHPDRRAEDVWWRYARSVHARINHRKEE